MDRKKINFIGKIFFWIITIIAIRFMCYKQVAEVHELKRTISDAQVIKVGKNEKFKTITGAINSIKESGIGEKYDIIIEEGYYDIYEELGGDSWFKSVTAENGEKQGVLLPPYVNLIGIGEVVFSLEASDSLATKENVPYISVLNLEDTNIIRNIKFVGKNVRYVIHDESKGKENIYREFDGCYFEHKGNVNGSWWARHTIGCGTSSNGEYYYKNCQIVNDVQGFYVHNQAFYPLPSKIIFENTEILNVAGGSSVAVETLEHSISDLIVCFFDCNITGYIELRGKRCRIEGYGNNKSVAIVNKGEKEYLNAGFSDEIQNCINFTGDEIKRFDFVSVKDGMIDKVVDNADLFSGIAMNSAQDKERVVVKTSGTVDITSMNLELEEGASVTIKEGRLVKAGEVDVIVGTYYQIGDYDFLKID